MENLAYKTDIEQTRKGSLGSSDAKMLLQIAQNGRVPQSAYKRLAICKGLLGNENITNAAMRYGDFIENAVYENLKASDILWQSNPCIVSKKYSRKNVRCIDHIDFMKQDDENGVLTFAECKATRLDFIHTRHEYNAQLLHHYKIGCELAKKLGNYRFELLLCHYNTKDIDLDAPFEFDADRLTVKRVKVSSKEYDLDKAMDIVDAFLDGFNEYYEDEVDGKYLPLTVKNEFDAMTAVLAEIKEREKKVNDFKAKLAAFMGDKGIKKITTDKWSITYVNETETVSFDHTSFLASFAIKHPRLYKEATNTFKKFTKRKAFVQFKLKDISNIQ